MKTIADIIHDNMHRRCWTYRHYGNGKKRVLHHRFEVKGGLTAWEVMADNVTKTNPIFERLVKR